MSQFKLSLFNIVEIVSNGELPTPLVYALSAILIAVAIRIAFWRPSRKNFTGSQTLHGGLQRRDVSIRSE
jgi:hypothetical protein